jgi:hypothetical protein
MLIRITGQNGAKASESPDGFVQFGEEIGSLIDAIPLLRVSHIDFGGLVNPTVLRLKA